MVRPFTDRETGAVHLPGERIEREASRAAELVEAGACEKAPSPKRKAAKDG